MKKRVSSAILSCFICVILALGVECQYCGNTGIESYAHRPVAIVPASSIGAPDTFSRSVVGMYWEFTIVLSSGLLTKTINGCDR